MKRVERGCARVVEQAFRIWELMPSGSVVESESRVARNYFTFSGAIDTESRSSWKQLGSVDTERLRSWGQKIWNQTQN